MRNVEIESAILDRLETAVKSFEGIADRNQMYIDYIEEDGPVAVAAHSYDYGRYDGIREAMLDAARTINETLDMIYGMMDSANEGEA